MGNRHARTTGAILVSSISEAGRNDLPGSLETVYASEAWCYQPDHSLAMESTLASDQTKNVEVNRT